MMTALCLILLATWSTGPAGHGDSGRPSASLNRSVLPPIPITVFASSEVKESLLNRIRAETEAIWGPAGITFDWYRVTSEGDTDTCQLRVTIDNRRRRLGARETALGWITFTNDRPDKSIHLSRAGADDLLVVTPGVDDDGTIASHEALLGRALGRALSHELGHYLLSSKGHTSRGLMRAILPSREFFSFRRKGFELTEQQREAAVRRLQQDTEAGLTGY